MKHIPVMLNEVIKNFDFSSEEERNFIDATFGAGGHSIEILKHIKKGNLFAFEKDKKSFDEANKNTNFTQKNFFIFNKSYALMSKYIQDFQGKINGILFDFGVSSMQLDEVDRGFSYRYNANLDMRFDKSQTFSAKDVINGYSLDNLIKIFFDYGEEKFSKKIAKNILKVREIKKIETTFELRNIIEKSIPTFDKNHTLSRIFQAIRIEVNDEFNTIKLGLNEAIKMLKPKGKIITICFHSLEDKIVKYFLKEKEKSCTCPTHFPICVCNKKKEINILTKKPIFPKEEEIKINPRSRSAIMRIAEKI